MSHIWIGHIRMSHVTHVNRCMLYTWMSHIHIWVVSYMNIISCVWHMDIPSYICMWLIHTSECVIAYIWLSHVARVKTSRDMYQCFRSYVWLRHVWNTLQHTATYCNILQHTATYCNNSAFSHTYDCVMSHIWIYHATYIWESRHAFHMCHVTHVTCNVTHITPRSHMTHKTHATCNVTHITPRTYLCLISHIYISDVTHETHAACECISSHLSMCVT